MSTHFPPGIPVATPSTQLATSDDEIIPTAIVIKNIPFNVKRETLLDIIVSYFKNLFLPIRFHHVLFPRLLLIFQLLMRSITISTQLVHSVVSRSPTSAWRKMLMPL